MSSLSKRLNLTELNIPKIQSNSAFWFRKKVRNTELIFLNCVCEICNSPIESSKSNIELSLKRKNISIENFIPKCKLCGTKERFVIRNKSKRGRLTSSRIGNSVGKKNLRIYCSSDNGKIMLSNNGKKTGPTGIKFAQKNWLGTNKQKEHIKNLGKKWGKINIEKVITKGKQWKWFAYDGYFFQSTWEKEFYLWLKEKRINFVRTGIRKFLWVDKNNKSHYYYPDFHLIDVGNVFVDPKNKYLINIRDKEKLTYVKNNYTDCIFIVGDVKECIFSTSKYFNL